MEGTKLVSDHGGGDGGAHDGGKIMVPTMGQWPQCLWWTDARDDEVAIMEGASWCPPCDAHDGMALMVSMQGRCPQWVNAHDGGNLMVAHNG